MSSPCSNAATPSLINCSVGSTRAVVRVCARGWATHDMRQLAAIVKTATMAMTELNAFKVTTIMRRVLVGVLHGCSQTKKNGARSWSGQFFPAPHAIQKQSGLEDQPRAKLDVSRLVEVASARRDADVAITGKVKVHVRQEEAPTV